MARRFDGDTLLVASHNEGKVREIRDLLAPFGVRTVSAAELDLPVPDETETTFEGNAGIKAHAAARAANLPALADDSGITVDALDGAPGVYTADWAETPTGRDFGMAMQVTWDKVQATGRPAPHTACFVSCLVLAWPDGHAETFMGRAPGTLTWPPRGDHGFGYDPMFVPDAQPGAGDQTFAEMLPTEKHEISHRADAFRQLVAASFGDPS